MKYLLGILLILFASFTDIFLFRIGIIPLQPSQFVIPLFLVVGAIKYSILDLVDIFKSHTFTMFAFLLFLSMVYSAVSPASPDVIILDIVLNLITLLLYVFMVHFFRTEKKSLVFLVMFISFVVLAASVWYDYFVGLPKFTKAAEEMIRKGGFGENPNQAASAMKFLGLCVLVYLDSLKGKRTLFILALLVSVFLTFSRGGIASVILILIFGTANEWSTKFKISSAVLFKSFFKMAFLFTGLYFCLVMFAGIMKANFPEFASGAGGERIDVLLGKSEKSVIAEDVGSGGGRGDLLVKYFKSFAKNPIGYGTAYSADESINYLDTHNYYLYLAVNFGALALICYLIYIGFGIKLSFKVDQFYYLIFVVLLIFEGFVTHHIFFNRSMLISLAFFDSLIYSKHIKNAFS
ncbi:O-antigen ligase family protein [Winogradskyella sp. R77965]|uniref:O-antigen ligase family protein n=1 Tax=Winogradskyella sp. R77965 TaxID=3093872 RepID=UPI0037DCA2BE